MIYLVNEDFYKLQKEIDFLHEIEQNAFSLILSEKNEKKTEISPPDEGIISLLKYTNDYGSTLFITEQYVEDLKIKQVNPWRLKKLLVTLTV